MSVTETCTYAPYEGGATVTLVPGLWPCALAGRPYMLETPGETALFPEGSTREESIPLLRPQADSSERPQINPEAGWRTTIDSWHKGAGQDHYDRADSNPFRFQSSKGIDPWNDWSLRLLPDVIEAGTTDKANIRSIVANDRLYFIADDEVVFLTQLVPSVEGGGMTNSDTPDPYVDIATDGAYVYVTDGSDIWRFAWDAASSTDIATPWSTQDADVIEFCNGRLMGAHDDDLFYFASDGSKTDVAVGATLPDGWAWVGFAEGPLCIYAAGYAGDRTLIFRIGIKDDGSGLDAAVPAGTLPEGSQLRAISSYLGFVLLGLDDGVRFAEVDPGSGNLTVGAKLATGSPVRCFEGQGSFVWFGWENFDATSTGLGRMDLREFGDVAALAPAFASDLMVDGSGEVHTVNTFDGLRVFTVAEQGVYVEHPTDLVASGWLTTGEITFGLVEPKTAGLVEVLAEAYAGGVGVEVSTDAGATWVDLGRKTTDAPFNALGRRSRRFDLRLTLTRDGDDDSEGPEVTGLNFTARPAVDSGRLVFAALLLHAEVEDLRGNPRRVDVAFELDSIHALNESGQVVAYQQGRRLRNVTVEDTEFRLWGLADDGSEQGSVLVRMKEVG